MSVVAFLILVTLAICGVSFWVILKQNEGLEASMRIFAHVNQALELNLAIEEQAIAIRDIVLIDDLELKRSEKAKMDQNAVRRLQPILASFQPVDEAERGPWESFQKSWAAHSDLMERVYQDSLRNTLHFAKVGSLKHSARYWLGYVPHFQSIVEITRPRFADDPVQLALGLAALDAIEATKSLLLWEKSAIMALDMNERSVFVENGRQDMARVTRNLNFLERALTSPAVSDAELAEFNERFREAGAGKIRFLEAGEIDWDVTHFTLPAHFIHPALPELSKIFWERIKPIRGGGTEIFNHVIGLTIEDTNTAAFESLMTFGKPMREAESRWIGQIVDYGATLMRDGMDTLESAFTRCLAILASVTALGLLLGAVFSLSFVSKLSASLQKLDSDLNDRSGGVQKLARQLGLTADELASGAHNSSASLQQTSATLEELNSMTARNASNSVEADKLMSLAAESVARARRSMDNVIGAMREISESGDEIGKIIKSIDEIAFQTNLLALNAAVEAARAGDAGAGFAVVAEEVRNLASRSADAAKNTARLIETTISNINGGSRMVNDTAENFRVVTENSGKVAALITEVAEASKEQSQGIDQIFKAMTAIDHVTQANAVSAQQSLEIASTLGREQGKLRETILDIDQLINGPNGGHNGGHAGGHAEAAGPGRRGSHGGAAARGSASAAKLSLPGPY
jgi:hypothetical protein